MKDNWEERLSCATKCSRCNKELDKRIFSVYDHRPICMECKKEEESRPDYEEVSKGMIEQCMAETEQFYGDPGGYCFHHFYPFTCKE
jgi:hypothetical protein